MLEELRRQQEETRSRILKSFGYDNDGVDYADIQKSEEGESLNDLIRKGVVEVDDALEKAVYADTAENRKLGRVGQEYHRGKGKSKNKGDEKSDKAQAEVKKYSNMYLGKKFVLDLTGDTHRGPSVTSGMAKKPHEGTITKVWFDKDTKQTTVRFQTGSRHIDYFASQIKDRLKPVDSKRDISKASDNPFDAAAEEDIEKSDIMEAISYDDNFRIAKSGKEIKEQIQNVILPKKQAELAVKKGEADDLLEECGAAPTKDVCKWWLGNMDIECGYKYYQVVAW